MEVVAEGPQYDGGDKTTVVISCTLIPYIDRHKGTTPRQAKGPKKRNLDMTQICYVGFGMGWSLFKEKSERT